MRACSPGRLGLLRRLRRGRLAAAALAVACVAALGGCPSPQSSAPDAGVELDDLMPASYSVGAFADCTPRGAGYSDARCGTGLRCAVVQVEIDSSTAAVTQCVPLAAAPLKEGEVCAFSEESRSPAGLRKRYDRCADGTACVPGADGLLRCRRLCELRLRGDCKKGELCVLPTPVSRVGFCAKPDGCKAVPPTSGCPKDQDGKDTGCYVLGDDKGTAAFCWPRQPWGDSTGALDSACERSWNCQSGYACAAKSSGREPTCRPYCTLPIVPDGGTPPDLGETRCPDDLGTCRGISGIEGVGRCL